MEFKNKIALITGATSGIGRGIAKGLLEKGAKVIINYSSNEKMAEKTKKELEQYQEKVTYIKADVGNEEEVIQLYEKIQKEIGRLDFVINNAAFDKAFFIEDYPIEDFRREIDVNLIGRFMMIQKAVPLLKESKTPRIINIASRLGTKPEQESSAYCISEAGTIMLTKVAALELAKYNIKVNTVSPSLTITPLSKQSYTETNY